MSDALAQVKRELGRDAVILHTRNIRRGGWLGIGSRWLVEITATADARLAELRAAAGRIPPRSAVQEEDAATTLPARAHDLRPLPPPRRRSAAPPPPSPAAAAVATAPRVESNIGEKIPATACRATASVADEAPGIANDGIPALRRPAISGAPAADTSHNPADLASGAAVGSGSPVTSALTERLPFGMGRTDPALRAEVMEIRTMVKDLLRQNEAAQRPAVPAELVDFYTQLIGQDVARELVGQIIERVARRLNERRAVHWDEHGRPVDHGQVSPAWIREQLQRELAAVLPPAEPLALRNDGTPTVVAIVGPTGVGKTTTIAKLAANMKLREGRSVGLITIDTYRIAAVEQLKTYAEILQVPLLAVNTPEEMAQAVARLSQVDLILIDTAGRSQKDELRIADLNRFLAAARPHQVHLVLSSTSREETIREAVRNFGVLNVDHVIFTKLDEAVGCGVILNVLRSVNLRLSYLTHGQAVPSDIEPGDARRVAQLLLGGVGATWGDGPEGSAAGGAGRREA